MTSTLRRFLPLILPLTATSTPTPTRTSDCSPDITWTVSGLALRDVATPNPLTWQLDRRRTLDFRVSSPALPEPHRCLVDTGYSQNQTTVQFDTWTYKCWDSNQALVGSPDPGLAFKFESAPGDLESEHPARFALRQEWGCGSG
ncbi:hypothetical protein F5Y13DRAFT_52107 [Hypoxylon sp. FL1857]|nr:hypothetical protein F5Y13DRAFT_52107 [Hypoxylon sp. FL1857]